MSQPSLEYNLGSFGYQNSIHLSLLAFQDSRTEFCLLFSSPENKRLKPIHIQLTEVVFVRLYELLFEAEAQINKLFALNRISALVLPQEETHFRSNLGDVRYNTCILGVTILVAKDATGCLQIFAVDTKSRANGFSVIFDDDEFNKLKNVFRETYRNIFEHKQENALRSDMSANKPEVKQEARNKKFLTLSINGKFSPLDVRNIGEAHLALKEIRLMKKEISLKKRNTEQKIRQIRADYASQRQRQPSKMRGGGWFGTFVRAFQAVDTDQQRYNLARQIDILEQQRRYHESLITQLDYYALELDKIMQGKGGLNYGY